MDYLVIMYYILASVGSIATVVAIIIAIRIPRKIASQQDKIALFSKRWEIYQLLLNIQIFKIRCNDTENSQSYLWKIGSYYDIMVITFFERMHFKENEKVIILIEIKKLKLKLHQAEFLFDFKDIRDLEKLKKHFDTFLDSCIAYFIPSALNKVESINFVTIEDHKREFIKSFDTYGEKIISEIEEYLKLSI